MEESKESQKGIRLKIILTIVGTIAMSIVIHEFAHYIMAVFLGYPAQMNFAGAGIAYTYFQMSPLNYTSLFMVASMGPIANFFMFMFGRHFTNIPNNDYGHWLFYYVLYLSNLYFLGINIVPYGGSDGSIMFFAIKSLLGI